MSVAKANRLIQYPEGTVNVIHQNGSTQDIINVILEADKKAYLQTKNFAPMLLGANDNETCQNIWKFIHGNIRYVKDPVGFEKVKSPAKTWKDRYGDCKSMSLFAGSILKNLGIPYAYRFTSYEKRGNYTHVYVVAAGQYIIDAVHGKYNEEVPYEKKKDYQMTKIAYLGSIPTQKNIVTRDERTGYIPFNSMTDGELAIALMDRRLEILENADVDGRVSQARVIVKDVAHSMHTPEKANQLTLYLDGMGLTDLARNLRKEIAEPYHFDTKARLLGIGDLKRSEKDFDRPALFGECASKGSNWLLKKSPLTAAQKSIMKTCYDEAMRLYPNGVYVSKKGFLGIGRELGFQKEWCDFAKKCYNNKNVETAINGQLEKTGFTAFYSFKPAQYIGDNNKYIQVANKTNSQDMFINIISNTSGVSEANVRGYITNGVLAKPIQGQRYTPAQVYDLWRNGLLSLSPQEVAAIGAPGVAETIIAIIVAVGTAIGAATGLINAVKGQVTDSSLIALGANNMAPNKDDFSGLGGGGITAGFNLNAMLPIFAVGAGLFLIMDPPKKSK